MILSSFLPYYNYCYVLFIASGTTAGYDNILPELLKHMGPRAKLWLTSFFSRIVHEKRIPQTWHQAKIIAIPKPGKDHSVTANYRPISLLSVCFKCLEYLILQRIKPVLEGSTILEQAGFRSDQRALVLALSVLALLDRYHLAIPLSHVNSDIFVNKNKNENENYYASLTRTRTKNFRRTRTK